MQKDKIIKICIIISIFILCGCLYSCKDSNKETILLEAEAGDLATGTEEN